MNGFYPLWGSGQRYEWSSLWMDFILFGVVVNVMNGQSYEWILSSLG